MKRALLMAVGAVLVGALAVSAQYTFNNWRAPLGVNGFEIIKTMTFDFTDSLAANSNTLAVVYLPRAITVKQIDVWAKTAFLGPGADSSATVSFRSTTGATAYLDSGATFQSTNMADVDFAASSQCSLLTTDGGGTCTGGTGGTITLWYTDKGR